MIRNDFGSIFNSFVKGIVSIGTIITSRNRGLVGRGRNGMIRNCFTNVSGGDETSNERGIGGLFRGGNYSFVTNSYTKGNNTVGNHFTGSFVG